MFAYFKIRQQLNAILFSLENVKKANKIFHEDEPEFDIQEIIDKFKHV